MLLGCRPTVPHDATLWHTRGRAHILLYTILNIAMCCITYHFMWHPPICFVFHCMCNRFMAFPTKYFVLILCSGSHWFACRYLQSNIVLCCIISLVPTDTVTHCYALSCIDWYGNGALDSYYKCKTTIKNNVKQSAHFILNFMYYMEDVATSRLSWK